MKPSPTLKTRMLSLCERLLGCAENYRNNGALLAAERAIEIHELIKLEIKAFNEDLAANLCNVGATTNEFYKHHVPIEVEEPGVGKVIHPPHGVWGWLYPPNLSRRRAYSSIGSYVDEFGNIWPASHTALLRFEPDPDVRANVAIAEPQEERSPWQPAKAAPKDQTIPVLAYYEGVSARAISGNMDCGQFFPDGIHGSAPFTHWMPIPKIPTTYKKTSQ